MELDISRIAYKSFEAFAEEIKKDSKSACAFGSIDDEILMSAFAQCTLTTCRLISIEVNKLAELNKLANATTIN